MDLKILEFSQDECEKGRLHNSSRQKNYVLFPLLLIVIASL